ncbi:MAG: alpha/beta hydrolase [Candidatus Eiseniibacteriota bacterium]
MRVILVIGAVYVVYAAVVFFAQRTLMYPGTSRVAAEDAAPRGPGFERHWIEVEGGRIEAWWLGPVEDAAADSAPAPPSPDASAPPTRRPAFLWFHGNGELIDDWPELVRGVRELGAGVLLVEFPGYGRSSGKPTEATITAAAVAAYDWMAARSDVDPARIFAFGRSLGGGAACAVAARRDVAGLVLHSTFTSVRPFAKLYLVPGFLVRDVFDNRRVVAAYDGPVLVLHGRQDEVVPYSHGVALARVAKQGTLITYETSHNDWPVERLAGDVAITFVAAYR